MSARTRQLPFANRPLGGAAGYCPRFAGRALTAAWLSPAGIPTRIKGSDCGLDSNHAEQMQM